MSAPFLDQLRSICATRAAYPAIVHRDRVYSYGELDHMAEQSAAWLQSLGLEKGDRVVLYTSERMPFLAAHLGILYAGGVSLPLNPRFTREEMRYFLEDSGARIAVAGAESRAAIE